MKNGPPFWKTSLNQLIDSLASLAQKVATNERLRQANHW
jgi:hypothetical protein